MHQQMNSLAYNMYIMHLEYRPIGLQFYMLKANTEYCIISLCNIVLCIIIFIIIF